MEIFNDRLEPSAIEKNEDAPRKLTPTLGYVFPSTIMVAGISTSVGLNSASSFSQSLCSNSRKTVRKALVSKNLDFVSLVTSDGETLGPILPSGRFPPPPGPPRPPRLPPGPPRLPPGPPPPGPPRLVFVLASDSRAFFLSAAFKIPSLSRSKSFTISRSGALGPPRPPGGPPKSWASAADV